MLSFIKYKIQFESIKTSPVYFDFINEIKKLMIYNSNDFSQAILMTSRI